MRDRVKSKGVTLRVIAGTHVVLLGFDVTAARRKGLLGFTVHRTDHTENEEDYLQSFKIFKPRKGEPVPRPGALVSMQDQPLQAFRWGDYTAKPEHQYTYRVTLRYGKPGALVDGPTLSTTIKTGSEDRGTHAVFFNRGAAGSQAYARKFGNVAPDRILEPEEREEAFRWLSRGLEEAILAYIGQATSGEFSLHASVYEFSWKPVLDAFGAAAKRGAEVKIIYDRRARGPFEATEAAVAKSGIGDLMIPRRTNSAISHNKFIVLARNGKPVQVWTGSTNFTEGGIFGQSNVGHIIRDAAVAKQYMDYWTRLSADPDFSVIRPENDAAAPTPKGAPRPGITPIFSPRSDLSALEWYASRLDAAKELAAFTAAFGISAVLAPVLLKTRKFLRYLMVESEGQKRAPKAQPGKAKPLSQYDTFQKISKVKNNRIAKGAILQSKAVDEAMAGSLHRWCSERLTNLNDHVKYLHTKYLLLDALTKNPVLISGSANFSSASTTQNDENMVVVRGDPDLADIFLGEFMRLFDHFEFRDMANARAKRGAKEDGLAFLMPSDAWTRPYFKAGSAQALERELFS